MSINDTKGRVTMKESEALNNPLNYQRMAEPYESEEDAEIAAKAFIEDLTALRQKHRIADIAYVIQLKVIIDDSIGNLTLSGHLGMVSENEAMLARALGRAQADRRAFINGLIGTKRCAQ